MNLAGKNPLLITPPADPLHLGALDLSKRIADQDLSAVDLMLATLDRIQAVNPKVRAIVSLQDREILLQRAHEADQQLENNKPKGWLHGIPIAIKDLSDAAGFPTTQGGSPLCNDEQVLATESELFVQRLVDAGAIVIGKTNTPEAGLGSHTYNQRWGTTVNPYNTALSAGGSSGGAAVAVATGMLSVADGSDMMGSLRNPAGWNHLYSFRPTAGLLEWDKTSYPARYPLDYPISTVGPIAKSVLDMAAYLATMIGCTSEPETYYDCHHATYDGETFRIAWLGDWNGAYPMDEHLLELCHSRLDEWAKASSGLVEIHEPRGSVFSSNDIWKSWTTIRSAVVSHTQLEKYGEQALLGEQSRVREELQWEVRRGLSISDDELEEAGLIADKWKQVAERLFQKYDALALPSAQVFPFPSEWKRPMAIAGKEMDSYHRWMEVVAPASLLGLPVATLPAGFSRKGLPMGIQLIGRRFQEEKLLCLAQRFQEAFEESRS